MNWKKLLTLAVVLQVGAFGNLRGQPEVKVQAQAMVHTPAPEVWDCSAYQKAMKLSGRKAGLSESGFKSVQARKQTACKTVKNYLDKSFGQADPELLKAFNEVPREYFMYQYEQDKSLASSAYEDKAKPWAIGYGSALSDYLGQVYMTQLSAPKKEDVVLEIGTGSGYQIALLSRMVKDAYSIEIIKPLGEKVAKLFAPLGYDNVHTKVGDGFYGWPEVAGGFDIIIVTCAARYVPPPLLKQLKPGGKLVIPIGQPYKRGQFLYVYTKDQEGKIHSKKDMGVFFVPMKSAGFESGEKSPGQARPEKADKAGPPPANQGLEKPGPKNNHPSTPSAP